MYFGGIIVGHLVITCITLINKIPSSGSPSWGEASHMKTWLVGDTHVMKLPCGLCDWSPHESRNSAWIVFSILHIKSESKRPTSHTQRRPTAPIHFTEALRGKIAHRRRALSTPCSPSGPEQYDALKALIPNQCCDWLSDTCRRKHACIPLPGKAKKITKHGWFVFNIPICSTWGTLRWVRAL